MVGGAVLALVVSTDAGGEPVLEFLAQRAAFTAHDGVVESDEVLGRESCRRRCQGQRSFAVAGLGETWVGGQHAWRFAKRDLAEVHDDRLVCECKSPLHLLFHEHDGQVV